MFTGTGDANTDVGAHLMGFLSGLAGGTLLAPIRTRLADRRLQIASAVAAIACVALAWLAALQA